MTRLRQPGPRALTTRWGLRVALAVLLVTAPVLQGIGGPAPAGAAPGPSCVTPVAEDGFEPPCNPYLSSPSWGEAHRNPYAQASSPLPGPRPGAKVTYRHVVGVLGVTLFAQYTEPYADGGRNLWMATVATPDGRYVYKADAATGRIISTYGALNELSLPGSGGVSGAYSLLDRDNHLIVGRDRSLTVYGDAVRGNRLSPIARLRTFTFPADALCGPSDTLVGLNMTYDGRVAFATAQGIVGTIPREPAAMTAANVVSSSINGAGCTAGSAGDGALETVSNSIALDETGGIYVVTSVAMYRYDWDGDTVTQRWRVPYASGGESAVRIGEGSGSTPTLMGNRPEHDKFVVITDGQPLMHLNLFWRDEIPEGWEPLPGRDPRLACEIPVDFGDPAATASQSEQSVLVRGYASVVVNNQLKQDGALALLPGNARLLGAALAGGLPSVAPYGMQRLDWDPESRSCSAVWSNRTVSIPNGIPSMSTGTGLIYGIGQRNGVWGLEGVDFATGASVLRVNTALTPDFNSAYSAATIGPDGSVWSGGIGGFTIFR